MPSFRNSSEAIWNWAGHEAAGISLAPEVPPILMGQDLVFVVPLGPFSITATGRVVALIIDEDHYGFVYSTLDHHPFIGTEAILLDRSSGQSTLTISTVWRPNCLATRLTGPDRQSTHRSYRQRVSRWDRRGRDRVDRCPHVRPHLGHGQSPVHGVPARDPSRVATGASSSARTDSKVLPNPSASSRRCSLFHPTSPSPTTPTRRSRTGCSSTLGRRSPLRESPGMDFPPMVALQRRRGSRSGRRCRRLSRRRTSPSLRQASSGPPTSAGPRHRKPAQRSCSNNHHPARFGS